MSGLAAMAEPAAAQWSIAIEGEGEIFVCRSDQNLLAAMIAARRTSVKVGCRAGGCGVCRVRILRGAYLSQKMSRTRISQAEEADGIVLACRITPQSDLALVPLPLKGAAALS